MSVVDHGQPNGAIGLSPRGSVRWLDQAGADDPDVVGAKAANLAVARRAGLPVIDGFAVTVADVRAHPERPSPAAAEAWRELAAGGSTPLVVRSSSPAEDLATGSMAGMFESVVDVRGWDSFVDAYRSVVASGHGAEMAVLVQVLTVPTLGGVLFGVDPVSGRDDRIVVAAVHGGPHRLVSGEVEGRRTVLRPSARVVAADGDETPVLGRRHRRRLVALAHEAARIFGGPQDVEWAIDGGRLLLLQSRPVTAVAALGAGPILGPGPVAETFPDPLTPLEVDLWVPALREATTETLRITGSAPSRRIDRSPVVTVADRQVVVDLELTGIVRTGNRVLAAVDPRPPIRRLGASWRVGRLRGALPQLAGGAVEAVDVELAAVPDLGTLSDDQLLAILDNSRDFLRTLHVHEMLVGALLPADGASAAGVALRAIVRGRARGWSDDDIVARTPIVLSVLPPSTGARPPLPAVDDVPLHDGAPVALREQLRLRIRWVHELTGQVVREIGARLVARGRTFDVEDVRHFRCSEVRNALAGLPFQSSVTDAHEVTPVPARFRLSADGAVVAEPTGGGGPGVGASGGRATGVVADGDPAPGQVLVVRTLDPALAGVLGRVAAIVSETGSPLSHLAILAREQRIPVVVGFAGALERFPAGTTLLVDGSNGTVAAVNEAEVVG